MRCEIGGRLVLGRVGPPSLPSEIVASAIAAKKQVNEGFVGRCVEFLTFSDSKEIAETSEVED